MWRVSAVIQSGKKTLPTTPSNPCKTTSQPTGIPKRWGSPPNYRKHASARFQEPLQRRDELILDPKDPMRSGARKLGANSFISQVEQGSFTGTGMTFWSWSGSYYLLCEDEVIEFSFL